MGEDFPNMEIQARHEKIVKQFEERGRGFLYGSPRRPTDATIC
jgi:hypothetical protein